MPRNRAPQPVGRWNGWEYVLVILTVAGFAVGLACFVNAALIAQHAPKNVSLSNLSALTAVVGKSAAWQLYGGVTAGVGALCGLALVIVRALASHVDHAALLVASRLSGAIEEA